MAWEILIGFERSKVFRADTDPVPRIRNFGEDLWRELKNSGLAEMDLDEIDGATDRMRVSAIKATKLKTVESGLTRCGARIFSMTSRVFHKGATLPPNSLPYAARRNFANGVAP